MLTYMQRYLHGEHEQVWSELRALGDAVRDEPLLGDARAVARETMRRAHHNIEVLIPRLQSLGYTFGYAWLAERTHERFTPEGIAELERDEPVYRPPLPDAVERIAELEALAGALPITLRAWYEVVGSVNFIGTAPRSGAISAIKAIREKRTNNSSRRTRARHERNGVSLSASIPSSARHSLRRASTSTR